ncbi:MAG: tRNA (N6-threonylcarbamoyladenosine(37)-N6)-methyltransferase TrmO [Acidobacteriota bacterium]
MSKTSRVPRTISYRPIGVIRSEHRDPEKTPIQPCYARGCKGRAVVLPEYAKGLKDLDRFSHVILLYHLHKAGSPLLTVKPFMDDVPRGVFATRHPCRPNAIGMSVVRLLRVEGSTLHVEDVDILDGTPLLDIKPFVRRLDSVRRSHGGWTEQVDAKTARVRGRRGYRQRSGTGTGGDLTKGLGHRRLRARGSSS